MRKFAAILALAALVAVPASAAEVTIKAVKGDVSIKSAKTGKTKPAKAGQALRKEDQVVTGRGGTAHLNFKTTQASVLIKEKSRVTVKGDKRETMLSFRYGEFLIGLRRKLKEGERFRVRTPAAVASVRGTLFWGLSDEKNDSTYACFSGSIELQGGGRTVMLTPGLTSKVRFNESPDEPTPANIPADYVKTFAINDSIDGVEEIPNREKN